MILIVDKQNSLHVKYLHAFAEISVIPFFRYFQDRKVEVAIQTHLYTILEIENDTIRGYGHIDYNESLNRYFLALCVLPPYQKMGIGSSIIKSLLDYADRNSIELYLSVDKNNTIAQSIYLKNAFYLDEEKPTFFFYKRIPLKLYT